jgi:tetratricopeptide (TPR) repeat protein
MIEHFSKRYSAVLVNAATFCILAAVCGITLSSYELWPWGDYKYDQLGYDANRANHPELAITYFNQAIKQRPTDAYAFGARGYSYGLLNQYKNEIADCKEAIRLGSKSSSDEDNVGDGYLGLDQYDDALVVFNKVLEKDPKDAYAYSRRAECYIGLDAYKSAIADLSHAIDIGPASEDDYDHRGYSYLALDMEKEALIDFAKARQINPQDSYAFGVLGNYYVQRSDYKKALAQYEHGLRLEQDADMYNGRAWALAKMGRFSEARDDAEKSLQLEPGDFDTLDTLGYAEAGLGEFDKALKIYNDILAKSVDEKAMYFHRSLLLEKMGRHSEAAADKAKAKQLGFTAADDV